MHQNHFIYFPVIYFRFATGVSGGDQKAEIYGFWKAGYSQLNAAYEILL